MTLSQNKGVEDWEDLIEVESLHMISNSRSSEILSTDGNVGEKQMICVYCPVGGQKVYLHLNLSSAETEDNITNFNHWIFTVL